MKCQRPVFRIVVLVWIVFSILYVGYTQYNYFRKYIADAAYQKGLSDAVVQVIQQAQKCEAFPISIDKQGVNLINVSCLQKDGGASADTTTTE